MKNSISGFYGSILMLLTALLLSTFTVNAQTNTSDRDNMMKQLGLSFPTLPAKPDDPNKPANTWPSHASNPQSNWTDSAGHTITTSGHGLWNNYSDLSTGLFPGPDSLRLGTYTPINLLQMKDGTVITTSAQWWNQRRPEVLKAVQEELWGVIPPDSVLPHVTWLVVTTTGGNGSSAYIQKVITGTIDISRYPAVRNRPQISATPC